jgi:putative ABC transport system permease protein
VNFTLEGNATGTGELPAAEFGSLTPDFSRTIGMPLLRGRSFTDADNETGNPVVLVDQTAAERYWPNQDPIGKRILQNIQNIPGVLMAPQWTTIVGIVGRTKSEGLDAPYSAHIFVPSYQNGTLSMTIYVRTAASAESLQNTIRAAVQSVDPNLPVFGVRTMEDVVSDSLASRRFALQLMALFAATALLLAAIGIYGVMAYFVSRSVREIGIRMALSAQREDVLKMVVSQGMSLALIGVLLGVGASLLVANLLSGLLFGVSARDPITMIAFAALLVTVALAANYIPAYRATRIVPMVALRYE